MGAITTEDVAIAELVVYIPTALLTVWVLLRHGIHKQLGWIYLAIFCIIRIAGSALEIESVNSPANSNDQEWALILQSVGLSPLLLSTIGLLKRVSVSLKPTLLPVSPDADMLLIDSMKCRITYRPEIETSPCRV
jgi:hypothetical protein